MTAGRRGLEPAAWIWTVRANYWRGRRALGGRLTLTTYELRFEPHELERALGGNTSFVTPLGKIASVEVARRGWVPRKRLFVRTVDGTEARFLMPRIRKHAAELIRLTEGPATGAYG